MKGDITIGVIISGLFAIGVAAFSLYLLFKIFQQVHTINIQAATERDGIYLANALISHEKIIYEKNGIKYRGILNATKLDEIFPVKSEKGFNDAEKLKLIFNPSNWISKDKVDLAYQNSYALILIVDLDDCNENRCIAWGGMSVNLNYWELFVEEHPFVKFGKCLFESFDVSLGHAQKMLAGCTAGAAAGAIIGSIIPGVGTAITAAIGCGVGLIATLWTPGEVSNCMMRSVPEVIKHFFETRSLVSNRGLPVNIIYDDGRVHKGRVIVSLLRLV